MKKVVYLILALAFFPACEALKEEEDPYPTPQPCSKAETSKSIDLEDYYLDNQAIIGTSSVRWIFTVPYACPQSKVYTSTYLEVEDSAVSYITSVTATTVMETQNGTVYRTPTTKLTVQPNFGLAGYATYFPPEVVCPGCTENFRITTTLEVRFNGNVTSATDLVHNSFYQVRMETGYIDPYQ